MPTAGAASPFLGESLGPLLTRYSPSYLTHNSWRKWTGGAHNYSYQGDDDN